MEQIFGPETDVEDVVPASRHWRAVARSSTVRAPTRSPDVCASAHCALPSEECTHRKWFWTTRGIIDGLVHGSWWEMTFFHPKILHQWAAEIIRQICGAKGNKIRRSAPLIVQLLAVVAEPIAVCATTPFI